MGFLVFDAILASMAAERIQYQVYAMDLNWREMFVRKSLDIESIQNSVTSLSLPRRSYHPLANSSSTAVAS